MAEIDEVLRLAHEADRADADAASVRRDLAACCDALRQELGEDWIVKLTPPGPGEDDLHIVVGKLDGAWTRWLHLPAARALRDWLVRVLGPPENEEAPDA